MIPNGLAVASHPILDPDQEGCQVGMHNATIEEHQLWSAQRLLDIHVISSSDGRCLGCGQLGSCRPRQHAAAIFSQTLRLPQRTPGATHPERVGLRRTVLRQPTGG